MLGRSRVPRLHSHNKDTRRRQQRRQFATNSTTWRRIREAQLNEQPLCEAHLKRNRTVPANEVDHKDGNAMNNEPSNLQSLCKPCHSSKTAREQARTRRT